MVKVYKFWAEWCGPCKAAEPNWNSIKSEFASNSNVAFFEVDIENASDPNHDLIAKYDIVSIPTFLAVNDSGYKLDLRGAASVVALRIIINNVLRN